MEAALPGRLPLSITLHGRIGSSIHALVRDASLHGAPVVAKSYFLLHSPDAFGLCDADVACLRGALVADLRMQWDVRHPHVVQVLGVAYDSFDTPIWAVAEKSDCSLHSILASGGSTRTPLGLALAHDLFSALAYLHGRGVVHGNVKPTNVLCTHGRFQLADPRSDVARAALARLMPLAILASPYTAPEHVLASGVSAFGDAFAAGLVLAHVGWDGGRGGGDGEFGGSSVAGMSAASMACATEATTRQPSHPAAMLPLPTDLAARLTLAQTAWPELPSVAAAVRATVVEAPGARSSAADVLASLPPVTAAARHAVEALVNTWLAATCEAATASDDLNDHAAESQLSLVTVASRADSVAVATQTNASRAAANAQRHASALAAAHVVPVFCDTPCQTDPPPPVPAPPPVPLMAAATCQTDREAGVPAETQTIDDGTSISSSGSGGGGGGGGASGGEVPTAAAAGPARPVAAATVPGVTDPATVTATRTETGPAGSLATLDAAAVDALVADPAAIGVVLTRLAAMATDSADGLRVLLTGLGRAGPAEITPALLSGQNATMLLESMQAADSQSREALLKMLAAFVFKNTTNQTHLLRSGALLAIVRAMATDSIVASVQEHACRVLSSLALCPEEWKPAWRGPATEATVRSLRLCGDAAGLGLQACAVLANIGTSSEGQIAAVRGLGLDAVVRAMLKHGSNAGVQDQACRALRTLTGRNGENQSALLDAGGAVAIVRAMFQHWSAPNVIEQALRALREVAKSGTRTAGATSTPPMGKRPVSTVSSPFKGKPLKDLPEHVVEEDSIPEGTTISDSQIIYAVVRGMGAHPGSAAVQEQGLAILRILAYRNPDNQVLVTRRGGLSAMALAMRTHPAAMGIQEEACRLIANLAENASIAAEVLSPRVLQAVQAALQANPRNTHIEVCAHLLRRA